MSDITSVDKFKPKAYIREAFSHLERGDQMAAPADRTVIEEDAEGCKRELHLTKSGLEDRLTPFIKGIVESLDHSTRMYPETYAWIIADAIRENFIFEDPGARGVTVAQLLAKKTEIAKLAEAAGIAELYVFGSVARGESTADSDIDLYYIEGAEFDYRAKVDMQVVIREMFNNVSVDCLEFEAMYPEVQEQAKNEGIRIV